ncbi:hypothetical protein [Tenacibaculum maritimum]|uniref:hypothetical protein n=1 Tax=Tenacibaculum maritimum TaxID=107401 RepID=UPI00388FADF5
MPYLAGTTEESNVDADVINDTTTGENTNTNTNDTDNSNTDTSNNSSSDSSTTNTTDTTNSNSGTNTTIDTNTIENGSTDTNNTTSSTTEKEVVIEHNGKSYKNKDIIEVPYSREETNFAFLLKNYPKGAKINWQVLKLGTDNTSIFATNETIHDNFGINMKEIHILDVVANYNDEKIRVTIKRVVKEFEFLGLVARDRENKRRLARSSQTLWLVDKPSISNNPRLIDYAICISPRLKEMNIAKNDIKWYFNKNVKGVGKIKTFKWISENEEIVNTKVIAGYPNRVVNSLIVRWVDENKQTYKVVPPAVQFTIETLFKNLKKINDLTERLGKYKIEIEPKLEFKGLQYNEEDRGTRFYITRREGSVNAKVDLKYKVPLPPPYSLDLTIPWINFTVGEIGAFIDLKTGLEVGGILSYEKRNDRKKFKKIKNTIQAKGSGGIEFGAKVKILPSVENVVFNIKAYGKTTLNVAGKLNFKNNEEVDFKPQVYLDPLIGGFNGEIEAGDITIFNQSYEWQLINRLEIYP